MRIGHYSETLKTKEAVSVFFIIGYVMQKMRKNGSSTVYFSVNSTVNPKPNITSTKIKLMTACVDILNT